MKNAFVAIVALGLAWQAAPLHAQNYEQAILAQLRQDGYEQITITTTLLGRIRIVADSAQGQREIVLNPRTGEVLRDVLLLANLANGGASSRGSSAKSDGSGGGSSNSGGSTGSSGSGSAGNDDGDNDGADDNNSDDNDDDTRGEEADDNDRNDENDNKDDNDPDDADDDEDDEDDEDDDSGKGRGRGGDDD